MSLQGFALLFIAAAVALVCIFGLQLLSEYRPPSSDSMPDPYEYRDLPDTEAYPVRPSGLREDQEKLEVLNNDEWQAYLERRDLEYEVRDGDTLEALTRKYLKDPAAREEMLRANPYLRGRKVLNPGEKLVIPMRHRRR